MSLERLYANHSGKVSDKWSLYLSEYSRLFADFFDKPVHMLEIGIQNGGSLEVWSQCFPNAEKIMGCDINPHCAQLKFDDPKISLVIGNANTDDIERQILSLSPYFDLIIDDGSHKSGDIVRSFARYFAHLNDGGIFVVEDLHCSYFPNYEGGLFHPYSSIAFFKFLADVINHEHWGIEIARQSILSEFVKTYGVKFDETLLSHIHSVEFINSMCIVRKASPEANVLGVRVVAGTIETVFQGILPLKGSTISNLQDKHIAKDNQEDNISKIFKIETARLLTEIARRDQAIAERDNLIAALLNVDPKGWTRLKTT